MSVEVEQRSEPECLLCGRDFHLTARVHCPFPVSIASLEEHLESVVIVRTSWKRPRLLAQRHRPSFQPRTTHLNYVVEFAFVSDDLGKAPEAWQGSLARFCGRFVCGS